MTATAGMQRTRTRTCRPMVVTAATVGCFALLATLTLAPSAGALGAGHARPIRTMPVGRVGRKRPYATGSSPMSNPLAPTAHLTYYGGPVISNVKVVQVVWGSGTYLPQTVSSTPPDVPSFFAGVLNSPYLDWLAEYSTSGQTIGRGTFAGRYTITPSAANDGQQIDDSQIQSELAAQIRAGNLLAPEKAPEGNTITLYALYFRHGQTICHDGACSLQQFCAYHSTMNDFSTSQQVYYSVEPDLTGVAGCGSGDDFQNTTSVQASELLDAITDPEVGLAGSVGPPLGWYDQNNGEIADICAGEDGSILGSDGVAYEVANGWSNQDNKCIDQPVTPSQLTTTYLTSSSGQLAGGPVPGRPGGHVHRGRLGDPWHNADADADRHGDVLRRVHGPRDGASRQRAGCIHHVHAKHHGLWGRPYDNRQLLR